MTFEEFFKKKRIDLDALQKAQPGLFSEFKVHFEQMGEKSFDHTKKYWFNKTRREFPLAIEAKTDKVKIDNPLAEQTITESLIEAAVPAPKLGFTPKFKAAGIPKPGAEELKNDNQTEASPAPKLGFTPKFKAANIPKPAHEPMPEIPVANPEAPSPGTTEESTPKPAYKPRFNMKNIPKKEEE